MTPEQRKNLDLAQRVAVDMTPYLTAILGLFKPGAEIMVLVRTPGHDEADVALGNLDLDEAIALLERRKRDPKGVMI